MNNCLDTLSNLISKSVPSFSFNESLLMDPVFDPKTSFGKKFRRFQEWSVTNLRWPMPIFNARGIFQYSFGTIPHRLPITVVGKFLAFKLWSFLGSLLIYLLNYIIIEALLCSPKIPHFTYRNHSFGAAELCFLSYFEYLERF